jgi:PIN domain nuclease of toxin-antitoxin system
MSAVNFCEVASKLIERGYGPDETEAGLSRSNFTVEAVTRQDALAAAKLWPVTRRFGLSLGDRFCLALAVRLRRPALTADRRWGDLDLDVGIDVELIR